MYEVFGNSTWRRKLAKVDRDYNLEEAYGERNVKKAIQRKIIERSQREWEAGIERKSTLAIYRNKKQPKTESFYDGSWSSMLLFKARTGSLEVNARTHWWNGIGAECEWCNMGERETIVHMIVECEGHNQEREHYIGMLRQLMGDELLMEVLERENHGLEILLGFESDHIDLGRMRGEIVSRMKLYLMALWNKRARF